MSSLIRPAVSEDGESIKALMATMGEGLPGIDWSANEPFWLVAEEDGVVTGCIQAVAALPLGYISNLAVREDKRMGRLKLRLASEALRALKAYGCQFAFGFVPFHLQKWRQALVKLGVTEGVDGSIFSMDLRGGVDG